MKIKKSQLKRIIQEELGRLLNEQAVTSADAPRAGTDEVEQAGPEPIIFGQDTSQGLPPESIRLPDPTPTARENGSERRRAARGGVSRSEYAREHGGARSPRAYAAQQAQQGQDAAGLGSGGIDKPAVAARPAGTRPTAAPAMVDKKAYDLKAAEANAAARNARFGSSPDVRRTQSPTRGAGGMSETRPEGEEGRLREASYKMKGEQRMRFTRAQLKRIIQEELAAVLNEQSGRPTRSTRTTGTGAGHLGQAEREAVSQQRREQEWGSEVTRQAETQPPVGTEEEFQRVTAAGARSPNPWVAASTLQMPSSRSPGEEQEAADIKTMAMRGRNIQQTGRAGQGMSPMFQPGSKSAAARQATDIEESIQQKLQRYTQEELGRILNEEEESWTQQTLRTGEAPVMGRQAPQERGPGTMGLPQRGTTTRPSFGSSGVTGNITLPSHTPLGPSREGGSTTHSPEQLAKADTGAEQRGARRNREADPGADSPRRSRGSERRAARRSAAEEAGVVPQGMSAREFMRTPEGRAWEPGGTVSPGVAPVRTADRPQRDPATAGGGWARRPGGGSAPSSGEQLSTAPATTSTRRPLRRGAPPEEGRPQIAALDEKQRKGTPLLREMIERLADWSSD